MGMTHFDEKGNAVMVDVSGKEPTSRTAIAEGKICVSEEIMEAVLQKDQEEILRVCPWLEPVLSHEIQPQDRIVAYRIGIEFFDTIWSENCFDDDFHFRLRINGFWFEKNGEEEIRLCPEQDVTKIWHGNPNLIYDSDIIYFRIKDKI